MIQPSPRERLTEEQLEAWREALIPGDQVWWASDNDTGRGFGVIAAKQVTYRSGFREVVLHITAFCWPTTDPYPEGHSHEACVSTATEGHLVDNIRVDPVDVAPISMISPAPDADEQAKLDEITAMVRAKQQRDADAYTDACIAAAEHQGLTPLAMFLAVCAIPYRIDQTGGFIMVLYAPTSENGEIGVTLEEIADDGRSLWTVYFYDRRQEECEGLPLAEAASRDRVAALIQAHRLPSDIRARIPITEDVARAKHAEGTVAAEWPTDNDSLLTTYNELICTRQVPDWMAGIQPARYTQPELEDLVLLACTYPLREPATETRIVVIDLL